MTQLWWGTIHFASSTCSLDYIDTDLMLHFWYCPKVYLKHLERKFEWKTDSMYMYTVQIWMNPLWRIFAGYCNVVFARVVFQLHSTFAACRACACLPVILSEVTCVNLTALSSHSLEIWQLILEKYSSTPCLVSTTALSEVAHTETASLRPEIVKSKGKKVE